MHHCHSYRSTVCTAQLTRKLYEPKFTCARTKCEAIVSNVFAPWATSLVTQDLEQVEYVSLSIDVSNLEHVKLTYQIYDGSISMETKLLDFIGLKRGRAEELAAEVLVVIQNFTLKTER